MPRCWIVGEGSVGSWPPAWDTQAQGSSLTLTPLADGTIEIDTDADALTIMVTAPAFYQGSWSVALADLDNGPVSLVAPGISGSIASGATLSVVPGLWVYDGTHAAPVHAYQWSLDGAPLSGETGTTLVVPTITADSVVTLTDTATDGHGSTSVNSNLGGAAVIAATPGGVRIDEAPHLEWSTLSGADAHILLEAI